MSKWMYGTCQKTSKVGLSVQKKRRLQRYKDFQTFSDESKELFNGLAESDLRNEFFGGEYSLCITPGGAYGGRDKRRVEVFYGQRPFDADEKKLLSERGARLDYYLNDVGAVVCTLIPARTENLICPPVVNRKE